MAKSLSIGIILTVCFGSRKQSTQKIDKVLIKRMLCSQ